MEKFFQYTPEESSNPEQAKQEKIRLAKELFESGEVFPFPGLAEGMKERLEAEEAEIPNYSDYALPIADLLSNLESRGMRIVLGKYPDSGNIFAILNGSENIERDSLLLRHLKVTGGMDKRLQRLIQLDRDK